MTLTKDRLVDIVRQQGSFSSADSRRIVEVILEVMKGKLEAGDEVKISGFGKWKVKEKESRRGRNPHTGARMQIAARRVVTFHPSDKLRDTVNDAELDDRLVTYASSRES